MDDDVRSDDDFDESMIDITDPNEADIPCFESDSDPSTFPQDF